ncbi:MAG: hypothetical protein Fur0046_39910 [Cyanobacteria bacterium J069]
MLVALVIPLVMSMAIAQTPDPATNPVPNNDSPAMTDEALPEVSPDDPTAQATLSGTVFYLQRSALPPNAILRVQLLNVSRADAPAVVLGEQIIETKGRQVPFSFEILYDPAFIQDNYRYSVQARITVDDRLMFTSTQSYPVITLGHPSSVDIRVDPVSRNP